MGLVTEEGRRKGRSWVRRNLLYGSWWRIWHYGKSWRFTYDPTNGYGDLQAAMFLAAGICAAVIGREKSGEGDYVTCALQHAGVYALMTGMISAQYGNPYPKSRLEVICPFNNVYMTGDGKYLAMCDPEYDRDYNKIMGLIGREDLIDEPRLVNCNKMNEAGLNPEVVALWMKRSQR